MPMARSEHETEAEVTFTEPGSLGLRLVDNERDGAIELLALNEGSQAERHDGTLQRGMVLRSVSGASVAGKSYDEVVGMIQAGGRPLKLGFAWPPGSALVSFVEAGTLGLQLLESQQRVVLHTLVPGTQGEAHSDALRPGMVLRRVDGVSTDGKSYEEVLGLIQASARPTELFKAQAAQKRSARTVDASDADDASCAGPTGARARA
jgi:C-terminal processing protease CtpA/Prc